MLESITPLPPYLRIGSELSCEERFRPHLMKNKMQQCCNRKEVQETLQDIHIVVGTVSSISGHPELFDLTHFDVAIIDESSQILEPQIMGILCAHRNGMCAIDKFILIGDHKQLPAVVLQRTEESQVNDETLHAIGLRDDIMRREGQYFLFHLILQSLHNRKHNDEHHHTEGYTHQTDQGDDGEEGSQRIQVSESQHEAHITSQNFHVRAQYGLSCCLLQVQMQ
jgi:hypothetical protein